MADFALIFPGQGSQFVGMGAEIIDDFKAARLVFEEAGDALHRDMKKLVLEGPPEELSRTENTQPAILVLSAAVLAALAEAGVGSSRPASFAAGHSLGEYSALVAAQVLGVRDAAGLVAKRGRFMQEAVGEGEGAMAAVIGMEEKALAPILAAVSTSDEIVTAANYNAPGQIVISGHRGAVERAQERAKEAGARGVIMLKVSVPSHSPLMDPAARRLKDELARISFARPSIPVVANVTAAPYPGEDEIPDLLVRQLTSPVRWEESVRTMIDGGVVDFIEVGPGNVLAGLIKRIDPKAATVPAGTMAGLREAEKKYQ